MSTSAVAVKESRSTGESRLRPNGFRPGDRRSYSALFVADHLLTRDRVDRLFPNWRKGLQSRMLERIRENGPSRILPLPRFKNLDRETFMKEFVAKSHPRRVRPDNRNPRTEEAAECLPYLRRQIELVKPRVVLLLGATALKHIDKSKTAFQMGEEAGKFFTLPDYPGIQFMVLYHPAALLYNAKLKPAMWEHVKKLRRYLEQNGLFQKARAS